MPSESDELIEKVAKFLGGLGFNEVRVRWKLINFRDGLKRDRARAENAQQRVAYQNKICHNCGALCSGDAKKCDACNSRLSSHFWHRLARAGSGFQLSVTHTLLGIILLLYGVMVAQTGEAFPFGSFSVETLVRWGGNTAYHVRSGQIWRLGSAVFLHGGTIHLLFNVVALWQVGPMVEEAFGNARTLVFFMATGITACIASNLFLGNAVGIGASGALMGLIGVATAWGHKQNTTMGKQIRNSMLKWAAYCMVFGFMVGADNVAHAVGFLSGGALGWVFPQRWTSHADLAPGWIVVFVIAIAALIGSLAPAVYFQYMNP